MQLRVWKHDETFQSTIGAVWHYRCWHIWIRSLSDSIVCLIIALCKWMTSKLTFPPSDCLALNRRCHETQGMNRTSLLISKCLYYDRERRGNWRYSPNRPIADWILSMLSNWSILCTSDSPGEGSNHAKSDTTRRMAHYVLFCFPCPFDNQVPTKAGCTVANCWRNRLAGSVGVPRAWNRARL